MAWHTSLLNAIHTVHRVPFGYHIVLFLVATTAVGSWQTYRIIRGPELAEWVEVPATVDEAKIDVRPPSKKGRSPREYAVIKYSYRYMGKEYEGSQISFSGISVIKTESEWVDFLRKARNRGATVPCFVNPKNPNEAILTRERGPFGLLGWIAVALMGPCLLIIGVLCCTAFNSKSSKETPEIVLPSKSNRASASGFD